MFGNSLPDKEALLQVDEPVTDTSPEEFCEKMLTDLASLREEYLLKRKKLNDQKRDIINRKRVHKTFTPGDIVYVRDLTIAPIAGGALKSRFVGPFIVEDVNETRLECTLQSIKDKKRCIRHMTHLKKQEQLDNNNFVPAQLEENTLTSDDVINDTNIVNLGTDHHIDDTDSPDPTGAVDEVETEPLYQSFIEPEDISSSGIGHIERSKNSNHSVGQKRKHSLINALPTRKSARIRADDYSHSEVTIRK